MILLNQNLVEVKHFPNGEINLEESLTNLINMEEETQHITLRFENNQDLIVLQFLNEWLKEEGYIKQELHIPYMPYSRMDRKVGHHLFSLKYVTKFINSMEFNKVYILEKHSDVTLELINNSVDVSYTKELIQQAMNDKSFDKELDIIVFPDMGAQKRYANLLDEDIRLFVGYKQRDFDSGNIIGLKLEGDNKVVRQAIIVDDLCSRGGTFINISKECKKLNIEKISLIVTHLEDNVYNGQIFDYVDTVFTTNALEPFILKALNNKQIVIKELPKKMKMTIKQ